MSNIEPPPLVPTVGIPDFRPYSNVQPFTVGNARTYLLQIETLIKWIRDTLVPHIDKEIGELTESWNENSLEILEAWEELSATLIARVEAAEAAIGGAVDEAQAAVVAAEAARDLAAQYASDAQNIQDLAVSALISNASSATRGSLDGLYASAAALSDITDIVTTGRLSEDEMADVLNTRFTVELGTVNTRIDSEVETLNAALTALDESSTEQFNELEIAVDSKGPKSLAGPRSARPLANSVPEGTEYYALDALEGSRSNGVTWDAIGSGGNELAYAENVTQFIAPSTARTDIPGTSVTFTVGTRPILLEMSADIGKSGNGEGVIRIYLVLDGNDVMYMGGFSPATTAAAQTYRTYQRSRRITGLTPGSSHTAKLVIQALSGTALPIAQGLTGAPTFLRAVTV